MYNNPSNLYAALGSNMSSAPYWDYNNMKYDYHNAYRNYHGHDPRDYNELDLFVKRHKQGFYKNDYLINNKINHIPLNETENILKSNKKLLLLNEI